MSLLFTAPAEIHAVVEKHHRFGDIEGRAQRYRETHRKDPGYIGDVGRTILARHTVSVARDSAIQNNFNSCNDNGIVADALELLGVPHAEVVPGPFARQTHPELFAAYQGLRRSVGKQHELVAVEAFVRSVDRLTPDARDDSERAEIARGLLWSLDIGDDYSHLLTPTPYLSRLTVPNVVDKGWANTPYASIDFLRAKA